VCGAVIRIQVRPCGVARPQVADGGDDLQMWKVAASVLKSCCRQS
jgi:hypothetical protein